MQRSRIGARREWGSVGRAGGGGKGNKYGRCRAFGSSVDSLLSRTGHRGSATSVVSFKEWELVGWIVGRSVGELGSNAVRSGLDGSPSPPPEAPSPAP